MGAKSLDEAELSKDEGEPCYWITHGTRVPHPRGAGQTHFSLPPPPDTLLQCSSLTPWPAHLDLAFCLLLPAGPVLEGLHGGTRAPHGRWWAGASGSWGVYLRGPVSSTFCKRNFGPTRSVEPLSGGCPDTMERWHGHEAGEGFDGLTSGWVLPLLWMGKEHFWAAIMPTEWCQSSPNLSKCSSTAALNTAFIAPILCKEWRMKSTQIWTLTFSVVHSLWSVSKDPTESSRSSQIEVWKALRTHEHCVSNHAAFLEAKTLKTQTRSWQIGFLHFQALPKGWF